MLLIQCGDFNPHQADLHSAFYELFPKSGQNRSEKTFFELSKVKKSASFLPFFIV